MSDMLASGASGLRAYQVALSTVSENIANAGSAGYSRRTTNIKEVASIGATGAQTTGSGEGALATGVQRAGDMFKQAEVLTSGADLAKTETSVTWLDRIETSMSGSVLGTRLSSFFNSATTLAGDPTSSAARSAMLESASGVASAFSETGASLDRIAAALATTTRDAVSSLNSLAATLAKVNNGLSRTGAGTAGNAALLDQRDQVLDQMSALTDVTVDYDGAGRATVRAGGSGGPVLVDTAQAATVGYSRNAAGTISFNLMSGVDQHVLSPIGGALAGIIDGAQRIAAARVQLQGLAQNFVDGDGRLAPDRGVDRQEAQRAVGRRGGLSPAAGDRARWRGRSGLCRQHNHRTVGAEPGRHRAQVDQRRNPARARACGQGQ